MLRGKVSKSTPHTLGVSLTKINIPQVFTDCQPFWDVIFDLALPLRPARIMKEVVKYDRRPSKPELGSREYCVCGLSEEIWETMEMCWRRDPPLRPSASQLCEVQAFASAIDDRPPPRGVIISVSLNPSENAKSPKKSGAIPS
jgi:hypothetical protein